MCPFFINYVTPIFLKVRKIGVFLLHNVVRMIPKFNTIILVSFEL